MGSPVGEVGRNAVSEGQSDEEIRNDVWISTTEVTREQWTKVMSTTPWKEAGGELKNGVIEGKNFPASYISFKDAKSFCERLSAIKDESDEKRTYRLPTSAEWEYACRGNSKTAYSFGEDSKTLGKYAWYADTSTPHEVSTKEANDFGLYDMHGNVWEWCVEKDGTGVRRGGCFESSANDCRSAVNNHETVEAQYDTGFRVVIG